MRGFRTLAGAKAALAGIETFRTIRKGRFENSPIGVVNEIGFVARLFAEAAGRGVTTTDRNEFR